MALRDRALLRDAAELPDFSRTFTNPTGPKGLAETVSKSDLKEYSEGISAAGEAVRIALQRETESAGFKLGVALNDLASFCGIGP